MLFMGRSARSCDVQVAESELFHSSDDDAVPVDQSDICVASDDSGNEMVSTAQQEVLHETSSESDVVQEPPAKKTRSYHTRDGSKHKQVSFFQNRYASLMHFLY
jgi:hypothetical protein